MKKMLLKMPMRGLRVDADVHPKAYRRRSENSTLLGEPNNVLEFKLIPREEKRNPK